MLPEFPKAKKLISKSQSDFFRFACRQHSGGVFGNIPMRVLQEGNAMKQVYTKDMELETEMKKLEAEFDVPVKELIATPFVVYTKLYEIAEKFAAQQVQHFVKTINDVTELTGNVVTPKGGYSIEDFFEMLEKVQIDFDDNGQPILPTIIGGPAVVAKIKAILKESENILGNRERMEQIVELKRQQWHDRENSRKLVD